MFDAATALLAATALHLGFQASVTALVYPVLARVPADQWAHVHERHSRAITPLVAVVYGVLLLASGWVVVSEPRFWTLLAAAAAVATFVVTGFAARLHGRLGAEHSPELIERLLRVDRVRAVTAALALAAAVAGAAGS